VAKSNKEIVLEVLRRSFVERDPAVVEEYFGANYRQHNPVIADGPSAIAKMIPTLTGLTYEPGMAVADGELVMVHGRYTGWGPKPMVAVDIFRIVRAGVEPGRTPRDPGQRCRDVRGRGSEILCLTASAERTD
jgi:predicted SnoaL-like aldol condensation-catalyzing enzyme